MRRWVLQEQVWTKVLDETGFTRISIDRLPSTTDAPRSADTLLVTAVHRLNRPQQEGQRARADQGDRSNCWSLETISLLNEVAIPHRSSGASG